MLWGVVGSTIAILLLVILLYPFRIRIQYGKDGKGTPLRVGIQLWQPFQLSIPVPVGLSIPGQASAASEENAQSRETPPLDRLSQLYSVTQFIVLLFFKPGEGNSVIDEVRPQPPRMAGAGRFAFQAIRSCESLAWETRVGVGEAATTALIVGTLWGTKNLVYTILASRIQFINPPHFRVLPDWEGTSFAISIDCIFRIRVGEIILAWIGATVHKWQKGVHRFGHGERSSH